MRLTPFQRLAITTTALFFSPTTAADSTACSAALTGPFATYLSVIPTTLGLLGGLSGGLAQQITQTALDRSGVVNDLRAWSID